MSLCSITKREMKFCVKILPTESRTATASSTATSKHRFKEIREPFASGSGKSLTIRRIPIRIIITSSKTGESTTATSLLPSTFLSFKLIGMLPVFTVFIVFLTLLRVTQHLICLIDLLKLILCTWIVWIQIRMILAG